MSSLTKPLASSLAQLGPSFTVADGVTGLRVLFVNVYFIQSDDGWVLVDAALIFSSARIIAAAAAQFGPGVPPKAIILTHGHFDHVGALHELLKIWDVPVYAHKLELPFLTGRSDYPPGDPSVGGGMMAWSSPLYPRRAADYTPHIHELPEDGSVPFLLGWKWVHAPGHTPGQVALFRESDRTLLSADAFITQKQESLIGALAQLPHRVKGPPAYYTIDWGLAGYSVRKLAELNPAVVGSGHGLPMSGEELTTQLNELAEQFEQLAVPKSGRYVREPAAANENGIISYPAPEPTTTGSKLSIVLGVAALGGVALMMMKLGKSKSRSVD